MPGDEKNCLNAMSLDMTYFEAGGRHYLCWADFTRNEANLEGISSLYIATIDPSNPTQLTSKASVITVPEYFWENVRFRVNEGAAVIQRDDNVYLAYSASGTGSEYCIGLLSGKAGDDLTNPDNWTKNPYPIMTSTDFNDEVSGNRNTTPLPLMSMETRLSYTTQDRQQHIRDTAEIHCMTHVVMHISNRYSTIKTVCRSSTCQRRNSQKKARQVSRLL